MRSFSPERIWARLPEFGSNAQFECSDFKAYCVHYGLHMLKARTHTVGRLGMERIIVAQLWEPQIASRGTLIIWHGYMDHLGLYKSVIQLGLQLGLTVVGVDLQGHGLSDGPRADINSFGEYEDVHRQLLAQLPRAAVEPLIGLGQSTGGAILLAHSLGCFLPAPQPFTYIGIILLAPLIRARRWYMVRLLYLMLRHRGGTVRTFRMNSGDHEFIEFLKNGDPLQHRRIEARWVGAMIEYAQKIAIADPVEFAPLVIQGDLDQTVDYKYNLKRIDRLFPNATTITLSGARHHLVNETSQYRELFGKEIRAYVQQCLGRVDI